VLIVDDASSFRAVMRQLLERRGYAVAGEADCGATASDLVEQLEPDGVLIDVDLPDENGFELAARLTGARPGLAVLLTSVQFDHSFYGQAQLSGARGFVPKTQLAQVELAMYWPNAVVA
jgi:DNA-binding NarL/FixJ family response regulator